MFTATERTSVLLLAALLCAAANNRVAAAAPALTQQDYASLARSVGTASTSEGYASRHYLFGSAMAIATDADGAAVVAAAKYGTGRVVSFGHEGMLGGCCASSGAGRLVSNAAAWVAGAKTSGIRVAKTVSKPAVVTTYWNKVMDSHAYLAAILTARSHPMRDIDISIGYMHSGYPFMTYMDVVNSTLDPQADHWGQYHELGHNHQAAAWTWECVVEVTCNWFAARAQMVVAGNTNPDNFYGWYGQDFDARKSGRRAHFAAGASHDTLCTQPATYLDSFLQLIEEGGFGFKLIRDTIASYQTLSNSQWQTDDTEKMQAWVRQQSKVAGYNFAPYYKRWGWPVLPATEQALAALPLYQPPKQ